MVVRVASILLYDIPFLLRVETTAGRDSDDVCWAAFASREVTSGTWIFASLYQLWCPTNQRILNGLHSTVVAVATQETLPE